MARNSRHVEGNQNQNYGELASTGLQFRANTTVIRIHRGNSEGISPITSRKWEHPTPWLVLMTMERRPFRELLSIIVKIRECSTRFFPLSRSTPISYC